MPLSPRQPLVALHPAAAATSRRRSLAHQLRQAEILPRRLAHLLRRFLDAKSGVLIGHYIILVFWVDGLVVRWHVDVVVGQLAAAEILEQVCVAGAMVVQVRVAAVFILRVLVSQLPGSLAIVDDLPC